MFATIFSTIGRTIVIAKNAIGATFINAPIHMDTKFSGKPRFIKVTMPLIINAIKRDMSIPVVRRANFLGIFTKRGIKARKRD